METRQGILIAWTWTVEVKMDRTGDRDGSRISRTYWALDVQDKGK